jgi:hypothetical protein
MAINRAIRASNNNKMRLVAMEKKGWKEEEHPPSAPAGGHSPSAMAVFVILNRGFREA